MTDKADIFARASANRIRIADMLAGLTDEQWASPSLCAGWSIRDLAGHLLMPMELSFPRFFLEIARERGNVARASFTASRRLGNRPTDDLVSQLRERAGEQFAPPGIGPMGPLGDTCVHMRDAARPLGLDDEPPLDDWRLVLDFLMTPRGRFAGFVAPGRLEGLALRATDQEWSWGSGDPISGTSEALALAACGRPVALHDLEGPGLPVLVARFPERSDEE